MPTGTYLGGFGTPGVGAAALTTERNIIWGGDAAKGLCLWKNGVIDGATRDAGNTNQTHVLRPGLVLGIVTSTGAYKQYDSTATDGTQNAAAILDVEMRATDFDNNNADRVFRVLVAGPVLAGQLIGLDQNARAQLQRQFLFDDDLAGNSNPYPKGAVAKTANYTVLAADRGTIFTNQGAVGTVVFTLPTIAKGLYYAFAVEADQTVTVTSVVTDTEVTFNDAAADSVSFSTSAEKIGNWIEVWPNADATKWLVKISLGAETSTPTIAT